MKVINGFSYKDERGSRVIVLRKVRQVINGSSVTTVVFQRYFCRGKIVVKLCGVEKLPINKFEQIYRCLMKGEGEKISLRSGRRRSKKRK